jgi:hypothetical protein
LRINGFVITGLPYFLLSSFTVVGQQATPMCGSVVLAEAEKEEGKGAGSSTVLSDTELACLVPGVREEETCLVLGVREEATCLVLGVGNMLDAGRTGGG